jgi:hypothetical protein
MRSFQLGLMVAAITVACTEKPAKVAERPTAIAEPSPRRLGAAPTAPDSITVATAITKIDTNRVDSVKAYYTKRDTITVPGPATLVVGTPMLSYECTAPTMGFFTGCLRSAGAWSTGDLAAIKALGGKLILMQGSYGKFQNCSIGHTPAEVAILCNKTKTPTADRRYNPGLYKAWVSTLKPYAAQWKSYLADGTLMGAQIIDDIGTGTWDVAITKGQQDTMAMWWKEAIPGIVTWTREKATGLTGYPWAYLDGSITSYNARYMGDIRLWRDSNVVAAKSAKLALALGINLLNGGKVVPGCYHGENPAQCAMTVAELYEISTVQLETPEACAWVTWMLSPAYYAQPGVTPTLKTLGNLARLRYAPPCRKPV